MRLPYAGALITSSDYMAYLEATATSLIVMGNDCPAGYWCEGNVAHACPLNTFNALSNQVSADACLVCPPYLTTSQFAATVCVQCAAGLQLRAPGVESAATGADRQCVPCPRSVHPKMPKATLHFDCSSL